MKKRSNRILFLIGAVFLLLYSTVFGGCGAVHTNGAEAENSVHGNYISESTVFAETEQTETEQTGQAEQTEQTEQAEHPGEILNNLSGVVSIRADDTDGSCVIMSVQDNGYILMTASHVADEKPRRFLFAGEEVMVRDYYKSLDYDLAFFVIETEMEEDLSAVKLDQSAYGEAEENDSIYAYGIVADEPVFREGRLLSSWIYIEDFGYHMLWAEMTDIQGGMSGGGVFDSEGRFLGLLLGTDGKGQIVALPLSIIAGEWKKSDLIGSIDIFSN